MNDMDPKSEREPGDEQRPAPSGDAEVVAATDTPAPEAAASVPAESAVSAETAVPAETKMPAIEPDETLTPPVVGPAATAPAHAGQAPLHLCRPAQS